jgi:uncharacterized integral membrane protein
MRYRPYPRAGGCDMAAFFFLLAIAGGALVGDLVWENTDAGEVTVLDRTLVSYPQGWLLAGAAVLGSVIALLLVASVSSTRGRRDRRRQLRSLKHQPQPGGIEPEQEYASWLDESFGRDEAAGERRGRQSDPLYEQARRPAHQRDDPRQQWPPAG